MNNVDKEILVTVVGIIVPISIMGLGSCFGSGIITMFGLFLLLGVILYGSHQ
jgi:hypothetical protein